MRTWPILTASVLAMSAAAAHADVTISTDATANMTCSGGVCSPTASDAILNVTDLENYLAAGNIEVTTTGSGIQANNIDVTGAFSWSGTNSLSMDAFQSITVSAYVQNLSTGNVSLITNDGGNGGSLTFTIGLGTLDTSAVSINGETYKMVASVKELAEKVGAKPDGHFALAADTNARTHGVYYTPPIPVTFKGTFNGLGHTIADLEIVDTIDQDADVALFSNLDTDGQIESVAVRNVVVDTSQYSSAGGLVGLNAGTISNCYISGRLRGGSAGGLVVDNEGTISTSQSVASVRGVGEYSGGLAAVNGGSVALSFAIGNVEGEYTYYGAYIGGLVGANGKTGTIENSYATGAVDGKSKPVTIGGFVGLNYEGSISTSYSIGSVAPKRGLRKYPIGGFTGGDTGTIASSYWDTQSSGRKKGSGDGNESGITGLTTAQFQSGLPAGFDPTVWAEDSTINNGLPYLIANPPQN